MSARPNLVLDLAITAAFLSTAAFCMAAAPMALALQQPGPELGPGRPPARFASAFDTDRDGTISNAEIASASAVLLQLDANGDGRLTAEELRPSFARDGRRDPRAPSGAGRGGNDRTVGAPGAGPASAGDLADTLMALDRNSDGVLRRDEMPWRFQGLFERADADKDGALTRDELTQSASASMQSGAPGDGRGGPAPGGRDRRRGGGFDPLLRALDADRDGVLSDAEIAGAAAVLLSLDTNQDGQLTGDELRRRPAAASGLEEHRR
jgi:Ca2+-binding EF-hand superfamily protein